MAEATKISRQVLYKRIWSEPVTKLSKEFGLSDVGFAKLCKRNDIPRPPRGFWARKAVGQKVTDVPLPRANEDWEITINSHEKGITNPALRTAAEREKSRITQEPPIVVPDNMRGAHPLVSTALHVLEATQKDACGILRPAAFGCLNVSVSRNSLRRALLIMDALIKTFVARGYSVRVPGEGDIDETIVELMDARVPFGIRETLVELKVEPDDDPGLKGPYEFRHNRFKNQTGPSGKLCLEIDPGHGMIGDGLRRRWSDTQSGQVEKHLNQFVAGVIQIAIKQRDDKLAREARKRQEEEEARIEAERQAAAERRAEAQEKIRAAKWAAVLAERAKVQELRQGANAWRESRQLRAYIAAVRRDAIGTQNAFSETALVQALLCFHCNVAPFGFRRRFAYNPDPVFDGGSLVHSHRKGQAPWIIPDNEDRPDREVLPRYNAV